MKKIVFLITLFVCICLSGCDHKKDSIDSVNFSENKEDSWQENNLPEWKDDRIALSDRYEITTLSGELLYGGKSTKRGAFIYKTNLETGEQVAIYEIAGVDEMYTISATNTETIYVCGNKKGVDTVWRIDASGDISEVGQIEMEDITSGMSFIIKGLYADEAGYFYLWGSTGVLLTDIWEDEEPNVYTEVDRIYVKDNSMNTLYYEQVPNSNGNAFYGFGFKQDGTPALLGVDDNGLFVKILNPEKRAANKPIYLKDDIAIGFMENVALDEEGFVFSAGNNLYRYSYDNGQTHKVVSLSDFGILSSNILYLSVVGDAIRIVDNYGISDSTEFIKLVQGSTPKTKISLGVIMATQELENEVVAFNRFSKDTRIEIIEYMRSDMDYDEGLERLKLDIIKKTAPDIIEVSGIDIDALSSKGVFEDYYKLMEQDSLMSKNMILQNVRDAYQTGDSLYTCPSTFAIHSIWGKQSKVGTQAGLTPAEFMKIFSNQGKQINALYGFSADEPVLTTLCTMGMDQFIDWDKGECLFDNQQFRDLVLFAEAYQGGYNEESLSQAIKNNNVLMMAGGIFNPYDYQVQKELFGEALSFVGYPTGTGYGSGIGATGLLYAVNSQSDRKNSAWVFVRNHLLNGRDFENGFSVIADIFEKQLEEATVVQFEESMGDKYEIIQASYMDRDIMIGVSSIDQETLRDIRELIKESNIKYYYHPDILKIITEEINSYRNDSKGIDIVLKYVQNRVQLYLQENMK